MRSKNLTSSCRPVISLQGVWVGMTVLFTMTFFHQHSQAQFSLKDQLNLNERTWVIDGQPVQASIVDFNGEEVLLQNGNMILETVALSRLSSGNIKFLQNQISLQRLRVNRGRSLRGVELWRVDMQAGNGATFNRSYPASNSDVAASLARGEFPGARILSIARIRGGKAIIVAEARSARAKKVRNAKSRIDANKKRKLNNREKRSNK